jgi:hypothetical protein
MLGYVFVPPDFFALDGYLEPHGGNHSRTDPGAPDAVNPAPTTGIHSGLGSRFAEERDAFRVIGTEDESFHASESARIRVRAAIGLHRPGKSGPSIAFHDPSASEEMH